MNPDFKKYNKIYSIIYWKVNEANKLTVEPQIYKCENQNEAFVKQHHLLDLGFKVKVFNTGE